jgi:hypothetical protein
MQLLFASGGWMHQYHTALKVFKTQRSSLAGIIQVEMMHPRGSQPGAENPPSMLQVHCF